MVAAASRGEPVALAVGCAASQHRRLLGLLEGTVVRTPRASPWTPPWPEGASLCGSRSGLLEGGPPRHLGGPAGVCWVDELREEHVKGQEGPEEPSGTWGGDLEEEP